MPDVKTYGQISDEDYEEACACFNASNYKSVVFWSQQCIEKLLKEYLSLLKETDIDILYSHDLDVLCDGLAELKYVRDLTGFIFMNSIYTRLRYPSQRYLDANEANAMTALLFAESAYKYLTKLIKDKKTSSKTSGVVDKIDFGGLDYEILKRVTWLRSQSALSFCQEEYLSIQHYTHRMCRDS